MTIPIRYRGCNLDYQVIPGQIWTVFQRLKEYLKELMINSYTSQTSNLDGNDSESENEAELENEKLFSTWYICCIVAPIFFLKGTPIKCDPSNQDRFQFHWDNKKNNAWLYTWKVATSFTSPLFHCRKKTITCNRNIIDYIHFDPVIMVTFWLHLYYFSSFWLILSP